MSSVRNRDTDIEQAVRSELHRRGYRFRKHVRALPGSPDIVFPGPAVAVFVDGDFWHGFRFPCWRDDLAEFWQKKIAKNRARDRRNHRKLRKMGWKVIRLWQHQIEDDLEACVTRVADAVDERSRSGLRAT